MILADERTGFIDEHIRRHLSIIEREDLRAGYRRLLKAFEDAAFEQKPITGVIEGVKLYEPRRRYLFAFHVRRLHLLFYLRLPALGAAPALHDMATGSHDRDQVRRNPKGETTIHLRSTADVDVLLGWLIPELPLPVVPKRRRANPRQG